MAFPERLFYVIGCVPCAIVNVLYIPLIILQPLYLIRAYKSSDEDRLKSLHNEIRSFIPLFKKGSSETETLLFNFIVPLRYAVSMYSSIIYVSWLQ